MECEACLLVFHFWQGSQHGKKSYRKVPWKMTYLKIARTITAPCKDLGHFGVNHLLITFNLQGLLKRKMFLM
jgi:hypothetical protein